MPGAKVGRCANAPKPLISWGLRGDVFGSGDQAIRRVSGAEAPHFGAAAGAAGASSRRLPVKVAMTGFGFGPPALIDAVQKP